MFHAVVALALVSLAVGQLNKPDFGLLADEEIFYINNIVKTTWKAGRNFHPSAGEHVKKLLGVKDMSKSEEMVRRLPRKEFDTLNNELPTNFDPRTKWTKCSSLNEVRDQADCGSCWAFGAVEAMTDRICIKSDAKKQVHISAEDLLACCSDCGFGCNGGYPSEAWQYYQQTGIVTGGQYGTKEGCQPYSLPHCDHHVTGKYKPCPKTLLPTPTCTKKCEAGYKKTYKQDLHFGASTYSVTGVKNIMQELVENGPVEAAFTVYADFPQYKSGVYRHTSGAALGGHAVKIIGYGTEDGTDYWLVTNSWNEDWGAKGFFKIIRGRDECGIESQIVAGEPKL